MTIQLPARAIRASVITTFAAVITASALTLAAPAVAASPSSARPLAQGAGMGAKPDVQVRRLQRALERRGYDLGAPGVDGRFGPLTAAAVRRLQAARGLAVDGVVGQQTRKALGLVSTHSARAQRTSRRAAPATPTAPAATAPSRTPSAPVRPASVPASPRLASPDVGASRSDVLLSLALGLIAGLGIGAALRATRRRRRGHAGPARQAPPMPPARSEDTDDSTAAQPSPEPVIGYVTMGLGATSADHDRSSAAIVAACQKTGRELVEIVCDPAGGRPLDRPGLRHALGRITDGHAHGLVMHDLHGFSRSTRDLAALIGWLRDAGATLLALDPEFDTATPGGRQVASTLMTLGSREADDDRVETRANGRPAVRDRPELRERIASMRSAGMSLREIAERLNAERVPTLRGGARWRPSSIQAALGYRRPAPQDRLPPMEVRG